MQCQIYRDLGSIRGERRDGLMESQIDLGSGMGIGSGFFFFCLVFGTGSGPWVPSEPFFCQIAMVLVPQKVVFELGSGMRCENFPY